MIILIKKEIDFVAELLINCTNEKEFFYLLKQFKILNNFLKKESLKEV